MLAATTVSFKRFDTVKSRTLQSTSRSVVMAELPGAPIPGNKYTHTYAHTMEGKKMKQKKLPFDKIGPRSLDAIFQTPSHARRKACTSVKKKSKTQDTVNFDAPNSITENLLHVQSLSQQVHTYFIIGSMYNIWTAFNSTFHDPFHLLLRHIKRPFHPYSTFKTPPPRTRPWQPIK